MPKTNIAATGGIGVAPPPDAPIEISAPLQADAGVIILADPHTGRPTGEVVDPRARAAANERALAPLNYERPPAPAPQSVVSGKQVEGLDPFYVEVEKRNAAEREEMPAASNTDSPARGLPGTAPAPVRKTAPLTVSGGFGDSGDAMYFALNGDELLLLVKTLLDKLNDRITNDLRFSMALTYPRVAVELRLTVKGEVEESGFEIQYVDAKEQTPIEVAKAHGDSIVFVLTETKREFSETGEVETPPDALRVELGLVRPHKQAIQTGMGKQFADLPVGF